MADDAKQEKINSLFQKIEQGCRDVFASDTYRRYLSTMAKFHNYSFRNSLLIFAQNPEATAVAGYSAWKNKFKRQVRAGEKGIQILGYSPRKIRRNVPVLDARGQQVIQDGKPLTEERIIEVPEYFPCYVFDVSQTDGEPLPTLLTNLSDSVDGFHDLFQAISDCSPFPIFFDSLPPDTRGYCSPKEQKIVIRQGLPEAQTIKTAIHEITHADLHAPVGLVPQKKDRATKEVEAESTAYIVCDRYGIDTSDYSFPYLASWSSSKELPELQQSLSTIQKQAAELIDRIDKRLEQIRLQKETLSAPPPDQPLEDSPEKIAGDLFDLAQKYNPEFIGKYADRAAQIAATVKALHGNDIVQLSALIEEISNTAKSHDIVAAADSLYDRIRNYSQNNNRFYIYQLKDTENLRNYRFEPLDRLRSSGLAVDKANYDLVYSAPLDPFVTLNEIYRRFNEDLPSDFRGHSLSISDVVVLQHGEQKAAHYCDPFGFRKIAFPDQSNTISITQQLAKAKETAAQQPINQDTNTQRREIK